MSAPEPFDAVVVGASLGGLTSAALLAARGFRVALVDALEQPGGRCGSVEYQGYQIPFGHRDGHGVGDNVFGLPLHFFDAAQRAGAEVHSQRLAGGMRIHRLPARTSADLHLGGRPGLDRRAGARETVQVLTGQPDVSDETADGYIDAMRALRSTPDEDLTGLLPVTLGDWLARHVADDVVRRAILQVGEVMFPSPSENTSVGRLVAFLKEARA